MAKRSKKSDLNFEESLKKLEKIVRTLEDDQVPLEESLRLFEEGKKLARACEQDLQRAEERVRLLIEGSGGEVEEEDFEEGEDETRAEEESGGVGEVPEETNQPSRPARTEDDLPF